MAFEDDQRPSRASSSLKRGVPSSRPPTPARGAAERCWSRTRAVSKRVVRAAAGGFARARRRRRRDGTWGRGERESACLSCVGYPPAARVVRSAERENSPSSRSCTQSPTPFPSDEVERRSTSWSSLHVGRQGRQVTSASTRPPPSSDCSDANSRGLTVRLRAAHHGRPGEMTSDSLVHQRLFVIDDEGPVFPVVVLCAAVDIRPLRGDPVKASQRPRPLPRASGV